MGFEQQAPSHAAAPAHTISVAVFQKIDWAIEFAGPAVDRYFPAILVDQHERSRLENRVHGPIRQSHEAVMQVTLLQPGQEIQRHFSPSANHLAQKCSFIQVDFAIERGGNHGRALGAEVDGVGFVVADLQGI
jgi:hypothetical protein